MMDYTSATELSIPSTEHARQIAAKYQTSGGLGRYLASFASGASVRTSSLLLAVQLEIDDMYETWTNRPESESRATAQELSTLLVWIATTVDMGYENV